MLMTIVIVPNTVMSCPRDVSKDCCLNSMMNPESRNMIIFIIKIGVSVFFKSLRIDKNISITPNKSHVHTFHVLMHDGKQAVFFILFNINIKTGN